MFSNFAYAFSKLRNFHSKDYIVNNFGTMGIAQIQEANLHLVSEIT